MSRYIPGKIDESANAISKTFHKIKTNLLETILKIKTFNRGKSKVSTTILYNLVFDSYLTQVRKGDGDKDDDGY